jgi:hypothetical protein
VISGYLVIGFFFAIYQHFWGQYNYKPFTYNLGQGLVWPAVMFPVGKIVGGILILYSFGSLLFDLSYNGVQS